MLSGKLKLLFVASIVGWLILVASIYWPPAQSVSVPWAIVGLCVAGISAALVVREIRFSLAKHQEQIKANSTPLNKALWILARGVLAIGLCCLLYTVVLDGQIQTALPDGVNTIGATPAIIHANVIIAEQEFLFAIVGLFVLIFGLFLEAVRLENIIWYLHLKPEYGPHAT